MTSVITAGVTGLGAARPKMLKEAVGLCDRILECVEKKILDGCSSEDRAPEWGWEWASEFLGLAERLDRILAILDISVTIQLEIFRDLEVPTEGLTAYSEFGLPVEIYDDGDFWIWYRLDIRQAVKWCRLFRQFRDQVNSQIPRARLPAGQKSKAGRSRGNVSKNLAEQIPKAWEKERCELVRRRKTEDEVNAERKSMNARRMLQLINEHCGVEYNVGSESLQKAVRRSKAFRTLKNADRPTEDD